jgi:hypothetical protein
MRTPATGVQVVPTVAVPLMEPVSGARDGASAVDDGDAPSQLWFGADAWEVAVARGDSDAPLLAVAEGEAAPQPLTASTSATVASAQASRWVVPPRSTTRPA